MTTEDLLNYYYLPLSVGFSYSCLPEQINPKLLLDKYGYPLYGYLKYSNFIDHGNKSFYANYGSVVFSYRANNEERYYSFANKKCALGEGFKSCVTYRPNSDGVDILFYTADGRSTLLSNALLYLEEEGLLEEMVSILNDTDIFHIGSDRNIYCIRSENTLYYASSYQVGDGLIINSQCDGFVVNGIYAWSLQNNKIYKNIYIPDSIEYIGTNVFGNYVENVYMNFDETHASNFYDLWNMNDEVLSKLAKNTPTSIGGRWIFIFL